MTAMTEEIAEVLKEKKVAPWKALGLEWKDPWGAKGGYWTLWHKESGRKVAELKNPSRGTWEVRWSQTKQVFKLGNHDQAIDYASQILGADYVERIAEGYDMLDVWGWNEEAPAIAGLKAVETDGARVVYLEGQEEETAQ